jgi:dUTP pyrophosphatase
MKECINNKNKMESNYDFTNFNKESEIYENALALDIFLDEKELMINDESKSVFVRAIFDRFGSVCRKTYLNDEFRCHFYFKRSPVNLSIIKLITTFGNIKCEYGNVTISYSDYNSLDFLSKIYDNSDSRYRNSENYNNYMHWVCKKTIPVCKFVKTSPYAVIPQKDRASDVGYDLTIIEKVKNIGSKTAMYDTGIVVSPPFGFYTKIVPRSSLTKSGYILTNSMGIIDGTYRGTLKICLSKIDDKIEDLKLPFKCCQLILEKHMHYLTEEIDNINDLGITARNDGGFGSTNK